MTFHRRARNAAADEYGRQRAERYGRIARARAALGILAVFLLTLGVIAAAHGAFGG